jgi:ribonuclease T1
MSVRGCLRTLCVFATFACREQAQSSAVVASAAIAASVAPSAAVAPSVSVVPVAPSTASVTASAQVTASASAASASVSNALDIDGKLQPIIADSTERRQVIVTWKLIEQNGPFPYDRDGTVFGNFEGRLPKRPRGTYHEFTVPTPGARNRGARRLVTGAADEVYYTSDHYESFRRLPLVRKQTP